MKLRIVALLCLCAIPSVQCLGQAPAAELFTGYSFASLDTGIGQETTNGAGIDLAINANQSVGVAVNLSSQWGDFLGISFNAQAILAGPRFSFRGEGASGFIHVTGGVARFSVLGFSETDFALGIGGGGDVKINDSVSYRVVQVDYIPVFSTGITLHNFRIMTGVLFTFGSR